MRVWFLFFVAVVLSVAAVSGAPEKATCAVLSFDARSGVSTAEAMLLCDRFATELDRLKIYSILNRSKMREILASQEFSRTKNCSSVECAIEAGQILSVR